MTFAAGKLPGKKSCSARVLGFRVFWVLGFIGFIGCIEFQGVGLGLRIRAFRV